MPKPGDALWGSFTTRDSETGVLTDADSLPTGAVYRNGSLDATPTVTVTNRATGEYKWTATIPGGYAAGDSVEVRITATVASVTDVGYSGAVVLDSKRVGDLIDAPAADLTGLATLANQTSILAALVVIDDFLDTEMAAVLAAVDTEVAAALAILNKLDTALVLDGAFYQFTAHALELAPAGGGGGGDATLANQTAILDLLASNTTLIDTIDTEVGQALAIALKLETTLEGSGPYLFTAAALVNAPAGEGGGGGALPAGGLDAILIDSGGVEGDINLPDALAYILAACAGTSTGHGTTTVRYRSPDGSVNRILATVDGIGNRSARTLTPP